VEPAGDHQVQHEKEIAFEREDDALSDAPKIRDTPPVRLRQRRIDGTQEKRRADADGDEAMPDHSGFQSVEIRDDVRELGHWRSCQFSVVSYQF
jgi:hypothetical protein